MLLVWVLIVHPGGWKIFFTRFSPFILSVVVLTRLMEVVGFDVDNTKYNSQSHLKICKINKNKCHKFRSRLRNLIFNICTQNETQE